MGWKWKDWILDVAGKYSKKCQLSYKTFNNSYIMLKFVEWLSDWKIENKKCVYFEANISLPYYLPI